ncbi:MAG: LysM peptidoglycan-binding domain-containing protein [Pseudomonadota bacterium]|nr:LysM peptidoglycan-binding domain-containing protein [Pseudomonadota bacterium]
MPKYTGSKGLYGAALLALSLAGCAQTAERTISPARDADADGVRTQPLREAPLAQISKDAQPLADEPVGMRTDAPLTYVVKKGDTLWDIAAHYLIEPWQWPEIWYVNGQVANPHLIYPGDVLTLVWRDGRPVVQRDDSNIEYMSPRIRESSLGDAIPTIPLDVIRDFLRGARVVTADQFRDAPYVLGFAEPHVVEGTGAEVYVKNLKAGDDYRYDSVRIGKKYIDPDNGDFLGWEAIPVADMEVRRDGQPATVLVARSYMETRAGDRLLPPELDGFTANFYPRAADPAIAGRIISVIGGVSQIGQYQVVALSRGSRDGLQQGSVLDVFQTGRSTRDPYTGRNEALPELFAGTLMVFKADERVSFALVMRAVREIHLNDRVRGPSPSERR